LPRRTINVFQPSLQREELDAVARVFESNWIGKGAVTARFEAAFAGYLRVDRAQLRSINCCTEGLFQSMALLGAGPGDEVILPSVSYVGAANAIAAAGATPIFCDVDPRTLNATAESIAEKMTPRTRAALVLHYGGLPCDMDTIGSLLQSKGIPLVEDSACSIASLYKDKACGTFGDIGLWSFDPVKIVSTGDGGMIYCRDAGLAERAERLLHLGLATATGFSNQARERWWELEVSCLGRRAIMNDVASAIGLEQLEKLPAFIERRREIHAHYDRALAELDWLRTPPGPPPHAQSSYYMYWIQARPDIRDRLATWLRDDDIYTTFRYYPLHLVKLFGACARLPHAEQAAQTTLCIPIHQSLSEEDTHRIVDSIREFGRRL
jgi:dTDP-4-amino-4,6-dideoxygalactose transaminase